MKAELVSLEDAETTSAKERSGLRTRSAIELVKMDIPPRQWVLEPVIPQKGTVMIYGPRGTGKTFISTGLAYAVASSGPFLHWKSETPRRVLLVDGEMPLEALRERIIQTAQGNDFEPPDESYLRIMAADDQEFGIPDLSTKQGMEAVEAHLDGIELVILDNISTLVRSGRENDAESWTGVQEWMLSLRRKGISVLLIHHAGKGGGQRGTSRREDILDTVIALRRPSDYSPDEGARFTVHFEKARGAFGEAVKAFEAKLEVRDGATFWTTRPIEDANLESVRQLMKEDMTVREIAEETGIPKSTVHRLKRKIESEGY